MADPVTRLTLFPPTGARVTQIIEGYNLDEKGLIRWTDLKGTSYASSLPFAIEHIEEGHQDAPFHEKDVAPAAFRNPNLRG